MITNKPPAHWRAWLLASNLVGRDGELSRLVQFLTSEAATSYETKFYPVPPVSFLTVVALTVPKIGVSPK